MALKFHAPSPWHAIKEAANNSRAQIAVPYLGENAAEMLPVTAGSVLVTRFTRDAIQAGKVDPREVVKFIRRGISVFSQADLHARIYVFARKAFIGSANVSKASEQMVEACLETTDTKTVQASRKFVQSLNANPVTLDYAKSLIDLYPSDGEPKYVAPEKSAEEDHSIKEKLWIVPVGVTEFSDDVKDIDRKGTKNATQQHAETSKTKLEKILCEGKLEFEKGDLALFRYGHKRGFKFDCPGRIIHLEPVGTGKNRDTIAYVELIKWQRSLGSRELRVNHKDLFAKLCYRSDQIKQLDSPADVARVLRLWPAFRA